ncbi:MAG TPA: hypothetical protein VMU34_20375 [Mycobacterium sp.]|nr:hypothetical protein [Mycobacterium sp.]
MGRVNSELVETYGWPKLVDQVAAAAVTVPGDAPVFTSNYGEAGALAVLGPAAGLTGPSKAVTTTTAGGAQRPGGPRP